jgi:hypothetical protein
MTYINDEVMDIVREIEAGHYDQNDYLHRIASAAFKRAQRIGKVKSKGEDKPDNMVPRKRPAPRPGVKIKTDDDGLFYAGSQHKSPVQHPVPPVTHKTLPSNAKVIEVNGERYLRSDFVGKTFVIRRGTYVDDRFVGMEALITGAGGKSFKVEFRNKENAPHGPNNKGEVTFIWYNRVPYLFGK